MCDKNHDGFPHRGSQKESKCTATAAQSEGRAIHFNRKIKGVAHAILNFLVATLKIKLGISR